MEKPDIYTNRPGTMHSYDQARLAPSYAKILDQLNLNAESVVLEFGAGGGNEAEYMRHSRGAKVFELDKSVAAYQVSPSPARNFAIAHYSQLPYADNSFSVVHCKDALVHIKDKESLLQEFKRVLQPGGLLLLTTETRGVMENLVFTVANVVDVPIMNTYSTISKSQLEKFLKKIGFKNKETVEWKPETNEMNWYKRERAVFLLENIKSV